MISTSIARAAAMAVALATAIEMSDRRRVQP
jgi:hypothetical protein